jgi:DNA-binding transcriptional regulator PaaX
MATPALRARVLVRWAKRFGISEGAARVALGRMVAAHAHQGRAGIGCIG